MICACRRKRSRLNAAAHEARCSVSQFVLTSALERAAETLTGERHRFELNAEQWEKFMAALDAPPRVVPQLQRLFREPSPFEHTQDHMTSGFRLEKLRRDHPN